jgi:hypothetical protein
LNLQQFVVNTCLTFVSYTEICKECVMYSIIQQYYNNISSTNFNKILWKISGMKLVDREQVDMKLCIHSIYFVLRMLKKYVNFESTLNDISFRCVNQAVISIILLHKQHFHLFYWCNATGTYHVKNIKMLCKLDRKQILITEL